MRFRAGAGLFRGSIRRGLCLRWLGLSSSSTAKTGFLDRSCLLIGSEQLPSAAAKKRKRTDNRGAKTTAEIEESRMQRVMVFNNVSVDGYIADDKGDMSWARNQDAEWNEFLQGNAKGGGMLLFGRKTYDLMVSFWPTPAATAMMPEVAERMNSAKKVVFSKTMQTAEWKNTTLVKNDPVEAVRKMKAE